MSAAPLFGAAKIRIEKEERRDFVLDMFRRKKIEIGEREIDSFMEQTVHYSARDFRNLIAETKAKKKKNADTTITEVLKGWNASKSIAFHREFQMLLAAQHCTYPNLLPESLSNRSDEDIANRIEELRRMLKHS